MPTNKKRLNLSLSKKTEEMLGRLAERDDVPMATKAVSLIEKAIEIDEDEILDEIAGKRDVDGAEFVSHDEVWS